MDAHAGGRGVLVGYGKKSDNLTLWDMAEGRPLQTFVGGKPSCKMWERDPELICCAKSRKPTYGGCEKVLGYMNMVDFWKILFETCLHLDLIGQLGRPNKSHFLLLLGQRFYPFRLGVTQCW